MRVSVGLLITLFAAVTVMMKAAAEAFDAKDVEKLKSGQDCIECDLAGADLRNLDLAGVKLSSSDFSGADLRNADLSSAKMWRTNFSGANLAGANLASSALTDAVLDGAHLSGANLTDSDLEGADLSGVDLMKVTLINVDLDQAVLCDTILPDGRKTEAGCGRKAFLLFNDGRIDEAELFAIRAIGLSERTKGPNSPDTAMQLPLLARIKAEQQKFAEAEEILNRALSIFRTSSPAADQPTYIYNLNLLGSIYLQQGRFVDAEAAYLQSVKIIDSTGRKYGGVTSQAFLGLARSQLWLGKFSQAESNLKRSLPFVPQKLDSISSEKVFLIGVAVDRQSRSAEAKSWFMKLLNIDDNSELDAYLTALSDYYMSRARVEDAAEVATWLQIRRSNSRADFETYLERFPDGMFADLASQSIETLKQRSALSPAPPSQPLMEDATPGRVFRDCDICPELVIVPPGSYRMGATDTEIKALKAPHHSPDYYNSEAPSRDVRIDYPLAVGRFEVTYDEWDACIASKGCDFRPRALGGRGRNPVANVSGENIAEYLAWLNKVTGNSYRLLSEAEWEYVARARTGTAWSCGGDETCLDQIAWYQANSNRKTHEVGTKAANGFGVYDMHGNVAEWVNDCWHDSYDGAPDDGRSWGACAEIFRGGSYKSEAQDVRSAARDCPGRLGGGVDGGIGFRVVRMLN